MVVDNRKDKDPVVGRLDEVDDAVEPLLGLRTDASRSFPAEGEGAVDRAQERQSRTEPSEEPAVSLAGGLTSRSRPQARPESSGTPGGLLRDARERAQLDVATLAQRTRLARKVIEDIEDDRFDAIPPAYLRGYLRAAAKELGADGDLWIRVYESLGYSDPVVRPDAMSGGAGVRPDRTHSALWYGLLAGLVITLLGLGVYSWEGRGNPVTSVGTWLDEKGVFGWLERWTERNPWGRPAGEIEESVEDAPLRADPVSVPAIVDIEFTSRAEPRPESADVSEPGQAGLVSAAPELSFQPELWVPVDPAATEQTPGVPGAVEHDSAEVLDGADPSDGNAVAVLIDASEAGIEAGTSADPHPGVSILRLSFQDTSWVEVRSASEQVELRGVFHAGEERTASVRLPARVVIGNARAVALEMDGDPVDLEPHTQRDRTARFTLGAD